VLGVSTVALYSKGAAYEQAESTAHRLLSDSLLPQFARFELRELLEEIWSEQMLQTSSEARESAAVEVALRGSAIGVGEATIEVASEQLGHVERLVYRAIEWLGKFKFRVVGPPPREVREACRIIVSQPQAGSYRFQVRLAPPLQKALPAPFPSLAVDPAEVAAFVVRLMEGTVSGAPSEIGDEIADPEYRQALLKLIRNLDPDGDKVREIQFRHVGTDPEHTVLLRGGIRERIRAALAPAGGVPADAVEAQVGVLRALHLDRKWLEISQPTGGHLRCNIGGLLLDDVVGPMVNRQVTVTGRWRGEKLRRFIVEDVELGDVAGDGPG